MKNTDASNPLLSIVIPTRNRAEYAASAIRSILSIPSGDLELIVQDNSDSRELELFAKTLGSDSRLRYKYIPDTLSSVENFRLALSLATGEYVCCIGDDDGVNPEIVAACKWASANEIDALTTDRYRAMYFWPDFRSADSGAAKAGKLQISRFSGKRELVDSEAELHKCVRTAGLSFERLPKVYLGVVKRVCVVEAYERMGAYPHGTCPDMFHAVAVASFTKRVCALDYPLVVPGFTSKATTGLVAMRQHQGRLEDAPHLRAREGYQWPDLIPRFFSLYTFWSESTLSALRATHRSDLIRKFNWPFLYLVCATLERDHFAETMHTLLHAARTVSKGYAQFAARCIFDVLDVLWIVASKRITRNMREGTVKVEAEFGDLANIEEAMQSLNRYISDNLGGIERVLDRIVP